MVHFTHNVIKFIKSCLFLLRMIPDQILYDIIEEIAGSDVVPLAQLMKGKTNVSEFKMAEKLDVKINHVRNMLYRLDAHDIVESTRKKDKKKGWYVYYWTLNMQKLKELSIRIKSDHLEKLEQRIKKEETIDYFKCPEKHIRASLTLAMEHEFKCPECALNLEKEDNTKIIESIQKTIAKLKSEIDFLKNLHIEPIKKMKTEKKKTKSKQRKETKPKKHSHKKMKTEKKLSRK